ncbi:MAG: tyrosine-type recombinase/integrase [Acidobacteria bacterium]|nr:tyrosine-type recombinase/integrase [Acidobacteriota bacterium]
MKGRSTPTLRAFTVGPWKTACYERCKPSTKRRVDSALDTQLLPVFGDERIDRITAGAVHRWFDRYSLRAPAGANRALDVLRQILNHALACGHVATNPTAGVRRNPRPLLTRFLSRAEIDRLHAALDEHRGRGPGRQQADIIRLLLLTGCRKGEIVNLRWSELGSDTLRLSDGKAGPRTVYLNEGAQAILQRQPRGRSRFVFPALSDASKPRSNELSLWRKVRQQAGIQDVRLHDLRHTFASHAVIQGVPLPVVSRLLGHSQSRMTLRYAHVSDIEVEAAAERIGVGIAELLNAGQAAPGGPYAGRGRLGNALSGIRHPGLELRRRVARADWTVAHTAERLGCTRQTVSRLLHGRSGVSPKMALALERIGWGRAVDWLSRQARYELAVERRGRRLPALSGS